MAKRNGKIHFAKIENSPRLQRLRDFLKDRAGQGATTWEILTSTLAPNPGTSCSELRHNGIPVFPHCEGKNEKGSNIYRYWLEQFAPEALIADAVVRGKYTRGLATVSA